MDGNVVGLSKVHLGHSGIMPAGNNLFNLLRSVICTHEIFAGKLPLLAKIHKMQLAGRLRSFPVGKGLRKTVEWKNHLSFL